MDGVRIEELINEGMEKIAIGVSPEMLITLKVIWSGPVFYDGQTRNGRVVRCPPDGDLAFEVEWGHAAMGEPIWRRAQEPFFEFLRAAGTLMDAAATALKN